MVESSLHCCTTFMWLVYQGGGGEPTPLERGFLASNVWLGFSHNTLLHGKHLVQRL